VDDLDRWTRVLPLGAGAFGEVTLSWDTEDRRWVALKRFTGQDELGLLRMVIESRIRVSHPHLVRTLAFRLVDDRAWLVTELARGGSLRALMTRTGALPWQWVAEAVDQLLAALTALHATGVVHRDLKPANLLLRSHGASPPHLLVGDFGIATWRTVSMTGIGAAIGTPGYLAPEYLDGRQPAPSTDLFAVGVLAAEMLAGRRLVHYSNASPAMPSSWHDTLPIPAAVPRPLAAVLARMADPDPARRYVDAGQAREALLSVSPPGSRTLPELVVPDLLASLPPGWTPEGPAPATAVPQSEPAADPETTGSSGSSGSLPGTTLADVPNRWGLPIDGGPTALVPENEATVSPATPPATPNPPNGSATPPMTPTPPSGSATPPVTPTSPGDSATPLATPPSGSPTQPPTHPATPPSGSSTQPPTGSATPPATPPRGSAAGAEAPLKAQRTARRRRKARRAALLVVLALFVAGAGTLYWAATHHGIAGQPSASGRTGNPPPPPADWTPTVVEPCSRVEIASERAGGTERCQRTPDREPSQHWVEAPPGGFPKSNAGGPFPGEECVADGDQDYSPVGDRVACSGGTWQVSA
jgi:serine/threonine protein kinase